MNKQGGNTVSSFTYTLNAAGMRTQMVDTSGTNTYAYDNLNRLTSVTYPGPTTDTGGSRRLRRGGSGHPF